MAEQKLNKHRKKDIIFDYVCILNYNGTFSIASSYHLACALIFALCFPIALQHHTGGLSKPRQVKSVIGLFRRESSGSGDAGSDPTLASQITQEMRTPTGRAVDRRSVSICGVAPIAERSENGSDPLGALAEEVEMGSQAAIQRRIRRASFLELNG